MVAGLSADTADQVRAAELALGGGKVSRLGC